MNILRVTKNAVVNSILNLDPRRYMWGFTRPTNQFESERQSMFATTQPRTNEVRTTEWKARFTAARVQENPDESFYELMENISHQIAVAQGLRGTHRFGGSDIQTRIMRVEDRLRDAMEMLHSIRPDDAQYISDSDQSLSDEVSVPPMPYLVVKDFQPGQPPCTAPRTMKGEQECHLRLAK